MKGEEMERTVPRVAMEIVIVMLVMVVMLGWQVKEDPVAMEAISHLIIRMG